MHSSAKAARHRSARSAATVRRDGAFPTEPARPRAGTGGRWAPRQPLVVARRPARRQPQLPAARPCRFPIPGFAAARRRPLDTGQRAVRALEDWLKAGPAGLVEETNRLIPVAPSAVDHDERSGDLVIQDARPCVGDWVIGPPKSGISEIRLLARINRVEQAHKRSYASLFWPFGGGPAPERAAARAPAGRDQVSRDQLAIRDLVSWFHVHYRIGFHLMAVCEAARDQRSKAKIEDIRLVR